MSTRPDHALHDSTRLRFLGPRAELPEGLSTLKADLGAFFVIVGTVGRDEALLLLLVRALRQRTGLLALRVNDLAWMLRVTNRRVIRWLDKLVRQRLVVYHAEDLWGVDTVIVEIVRAAGEDTTFEQTVHADLPTHWFVQVLPIIGRTSFTVFLYFLWCEPHRGETHVDHLVEMTALRGRLHAAWHLRRLQRHTLLVAAADGGFAVRDPAPPTRFQRLHLRFLSVPTLRRSLAHIALLLLLIVLAFAFLLFLHSARSLPPA